MASPLYRNAYALMINTAVTGVLGVLYWLLAARSYTAVEVGRASAAYSAMNLVSGFTAYNLVGAITRFLPQTGSRTKSWVLKTYLFSALASIVVTIPFLLTVSHWGPTYSELTGLVPGLAFLVSVVTWSIFTLQDGVMTGLRNAIWVPLENGIFGIVKIILLVAFAAAIPTVGIFVSWMLPVFVSLPLVNGLIFFKLMPRHEHLTAHRTPPTNRQIGKFLAGDYIGAMCLLGINNLVPILVAIRIGPDKSAYFYIAWTIGQVLDLLAVNMAMSVTVESAFDAATLAANVRSALRLAGHHPAADRGPGGGAGAVRAPPVRAQVRLVRRAGTGTAGPGHVAEGPDRAVPGGHAGAEPAQDDRAHPDRPVRARPRPGPRADRPDRRVRCGGGRPGHPAVRRDPDLPEAAPGHVGPGDPRRSGRRARPGAGGCACPGRCGRGLDPRRPADPRRPGQDHHRPAAARAAGGGVRQRPQRRAVAGRPRSRPRSTKPSTTTPRAR